MRISQCQHVALKLYTRSESTAGELDSELDVYKRIANSSERHPGRHAVRSLIDSFELETPSGRHRCLIHTLLWESALKIKNRNPIRRLPPPVIAFLLKRLFLALDFLHQECHVAHTDIKEANILLPADSSVMSQFEIQELNEPSPRKDVDSNIIYLSRKMGTPKAFGAPVLCDFGSAVPLDDGLEHREDIQSDIYRAPEVILDIPWTYSVDIWNAGCMVSSNQVDTLGGPESDFFEVWDAFEGEHLFTGLDPEHNTYRGRAYLSEMIALLGPPPPSLLARANLKSKFFSEDGERSKS